MSALLHYHRFEKELSAMDDKELLDLAAATRRQSDSALGGVSGQLVALIPSHGTSLIGTVYSGPRLMYYRVKKHKIEKELESRNLHLDERTTGDIIIPAAVGGITFALGAGADAMAGAVASHAANVSQHSLSASEWVHQAASSAAETTHNHVEAIMHPFTAGHEAGVEYAGAYNLGSLPEHLEHGADHLHHVVSMIQPGGEHLLSEHSAQALGAGAMATAIGEVVGVGIEKCCPEASGKQEHGLFSTPGHENGSGGRIDAWVPIAGMKKPGTGPWETIGPEPPIAALSAWHRPSCEKRRSRGFGRCDCGGE